MTNFEMQVLPALLGPGDNGRIGGFAVRDWLENVGEMVDLGIAMLDFPRDEPGAEDASIADHMNLVIAFRSRYKSVTGSFPETA